MITADQFFILKPINTIDDTNSNSKRNGSIAAYVNNSTIIYDRKYTNR